VVLLFVLAAVFDLFFDGSSGFDGSSADTCCIGLDMLLDAGFFVLGWPAKQCGLMKVRDRDAVKLEEMLGCPLDHEGRGYSHQISQLPR
jgi:hypothetical protein